jgi:fructose-1,6-bisphosphatase
MSDLDFNENEQPEMTDDELSEIVETEFEQPETTETEPVSLGELVEKPKNTEPAVEVIRDEADKVQRVFKIGSTRIVEDDSTRGLSIEAVQAKLRTMYPEVATATIREKTESGIHVVEFLAQPGRKG